MKAELAKALDHVHTAIAQIEKIDAEDLNLALTAEENDRLSDVWLALIKIASSIQERR